MAITTVFTNNRSHAIRPPAELCLPDKVKRVDVRAVSNERVIAPVGQTWDRFFEGQVPLGVGRASLPPLLSRRRPQSLLQMRWFVQGD